MFYMIDLKSAREIQLMRAAGQIVARTFQRLEEAIRPGVTLRELDRIAARLIDREGGRPLYKGYRGSHGMNPPFPGVLCTSVNSEICHGLPDNRRLHEGDIVGIDVGVAYRGYCGDGCVTFAVGSVAPEAQRLLDVTRGCLQRGIEAASALGHLNDIGAAIEPYVAKQGFSVVEELAGHGIGRRLHEPLTIHHIRRAGRGPRLRRGMVFTIEPMVNAGAPHRRTLPDGWTEATTDGSLSAQFEHTVAITDSGLEILTRL